MTTEKKPYKEVTLYNFATLRNAEYMNLENLKNDPSFIIFYPEEFSIQYSKCDYKEIELGDFDPTKFLDFDFIKQQKPNTFCETLQYKTNKLFDKIYHFEKNSIDDFYDINNFLLEFDDILDELNPEIKDLDPAEKVEKRKLLEKVFVLKVWYSYVANIRLTNNFKQKEIGHNLLKFYHLRKHRNIIDDEKHIEKKKNFKKIFNARIILPEELYPKSDTLFYGGLKKGKKENPTSSQYFNSQHLLKILDVRRKKLDKINDEEKRKIELEDINKEEKYIYLMPKTEKDKFLFDNLEFLPFVVSLEKIDNEVVLLVDFDERYKIENQLLIEKANFKYRVKKEGNEYTEITLDPLSQESTADYYKFDLCFDLTAIVDDETHFTEILKSFKLTVLFSNNLERSSEIKLIQKDGKYYAEGCLELAETDEYGEAFPPSGHGVRMLGIADYRKVVSTISRYVPAEVAHIENVMASEFREKVTTKEISTEITDFTSNESETEKLNETTTNDRFQMQNEVSKIVNEQRNNNFTASAGYSGGGYSVNLTTGNSSVNSKEQSDKQAVENAKEITTKAVEKIVSRVKTERTVKTSEKFIDVNKYGFDNKGNKEHVSGVYRHINAVYRNQIHNYGKRLAYEFSVPEPALIYLLNKDNSKLLKLISEIPKPIDFFEKIKSSDDLNISNYLDYIHNYEVDKSNYSVCPLEFDELKEFIKSDGYQFRIEKPEYEIKKITFSGNFIFRSELGTNGNKVRITEASTFKIKIDNIVKKDLTSYYQKPAEGTIDGYNFSKIIPTTFEDFQVFKNSIVLEVENDAPFYYLKVVITYNPLKNTISDWKTKTYKLLKTTYEEKLVAYKEKISIEITKYLGEEKSKLESKGNSKQTSFKRQIEISTLKRNCLSFLIFEGNELNKNRKFGVDMFEEGFRSYFTDIKIKKTKELDEYTAFVRFVEQAFEWENMSYSFYPYFWGANNGNNWLDHYLQNDDDPLHQSFLQAGMARVIVTVRPGFEEAVNLYMVTGKIWNGGTMPVYGSSLFVSIDKELNNNLESEVDEEWESVLPTNLIALQSSGVAIQQMGLPDLLNQGNLGLLKPNEAKLPPKKKFLGLFNF